jgi:hypothetical protein
MKADEEKASQLEELGKFAKLVKKQLRKAHNADAGRISKKLDLHDQPKAAMKVGGKDGFELWFRYGTDGSVVIDKIANKAAAGTMKINAPICHLRTAALLTDKFGIPEKVEEPAPERPLEEGAVKRAMEELVDEVVKITGEEWEKVQEHLMDSPMSFIEEYSDRLPEDLKRRLDVLTPGIREEVEKDEEKPTEEPEDFEEEFTAPSNKFAIVDASVIEGLDNELVEQAIIIPVKYHGAVFEVVANYDDTILRSLTVSPSEVEEGDTEVVKTTKGATVEGIAPLSHDSSPEREVRKTIKQIHHQAGDDKMRIKDPTKKSVIKRDQSDKDRRKKKREARRKEEPKEDINKKEMVKMLLEDCSKVGEFPADDLEFAKEVIAKLRGHDSITEAADRTIASIDGVLPTKRKSEAIELVDFINGFRRE